MTYTYQGQLIVRALLDFSIIDILKSSLTDVRSQQRAKRQFEEIGEKVAESLLPVFHDAAMRQLSACAYHRAGTLWVKLARTIAGLAGSDAISPAYLAEALQ